MAVESDSVTSRPIGASLIAFRREAQEANLIDMLRQKAGPAAIDYVVRTLIEAAYATRDLLIKYRQALLCNRTMPVNYAWTHGGMDMFVAQYVDVIKHDLGKLGYTLSGSQNTSLSYNSPCRVVALGACSSGSTGPILDNVLTECTHGPALRVSDHPE